MIAKTPTFRLTLAGAAVLALLAACDKPKPRNVNDQGGPLGATGATSNPGAQAPAAPAAPPPAAVTADPLPPLPAWSKPMIGKAIADVFPKLSHDCVGNTDLVDMRYQGASPGVRVFGWGWDRAAKAAVARVILTEDAGKIVGAGETGVPRPDVTAAQKDITSPTAGWHAFTANAAGGLYAYGLSADGKTACPLGHINL